jgi:hypothetical protein
VTLRELPSHDFLIVLAFHLAEIFSDKFLNFPQRQPSGRLLFLAYTFNCLLDPVTQHSP